MVNDYRLQRRLAMKCFMMYGAIGLFVMSGMLLSNKFVSHATPAQFKSTVLGVAIGYMLLLMLFVLFTTFRLKITVELRSAGAIHSSQLRRQALWQRLTSFPSEFFWFY